MKILPLFVHIFRNSTVWIPKTVSKSIDRFMSTFLWQSGNPWIKLTVLQKPWWEGGLLVANFYNYFLAGQLVFAHCWLPTTNAIHTLLTLLCQEIDHLVMEKISGPTVGAWKSLVNKANPLYKATHSSKGSCSKFDKVRLAVLHYQWL